jgi:hypothetical protein
MLNPRRTAITTRLHRVTGFVKNRPDIPRGAFCLF